MGVIASIDAFAIAAASVAIVIELIASFSLAKSARRSNKLSIAASIAGGTRGTRGHHAGGVRGGAQSSHYLNAPPRYVRAYAPLTLRLESAAKVSPRDGSLTLVFGSSPGAPEAELAKDVRAGEVSRLVIAGTIVDVVGGSVPSIDVVTGDVAIRVARVGVEQGIASDPMTVQPTTLSIGAKELAASALSSPESAHPGGVVRAIVMGLPP
jgi:hypothetical protein